MTRPVLWAELTRLQIAEAARRGTLVIVPVGAIEQHGPHLPVNTDIANAYEIALRVARREPDVLVAPPVSWGYSPHHMGFAGTITLAPETFLALLRDICDSIAAHGFRRILILNGHGGNRPLIAVAAAEGLRRAGVRVAAASYWDLAVEALRELRESPLGGFGHACELETSLQLVLQPDRVDLSLATRQMTDPVRSWGSCFGFQDLQAFGPVATGADLAKTDPTGILGDPTLASTAKGERMLAAIVDGVARLVRDYRAAPDPPQ